MSIINNEHKLHWILKSTNLDKYELMDLPIEQPGDSSQEHSGVGKAPTLDMESTSEQAPREGSSTELRSGVDPCQGYNMSSSPYSYNNSRDSSQNMSQD